MAGSARTEVPGVRLVDEARQNLPGGGVLVEFIEGFGL
jgi:hypothetical protein